MNQLNSKAVRSEADYHCGYQQALADFGIKDLKAKLSNSFNPDDLNKRWYLEEQDQESLIAILIQQLTNSLNSKLIDSYLKSLSDGTLEVLLSEIQPLSKELPINFKQSAKPCYKDGDSLRWNAGVDWGIAIGRFLAYAPHLCRWSWKYVIWLGKDSPSAAWVAADLAWEEDLEPMAQEIGL